MTLEEIYGLNFPIKSLAVANPFVEKFLFKSCYTLGQQLRPYCLFATDKQKENGVIDFATFGGVLNPNIPLLDEIAEYRKGVFQSTGLSINTKDEIKKKWLFIDYLMTISICYVEIPKYTTKDGYAQQSFDKFFCTRNPQIMATWIDGSLSEMQMKYSPKILVNQVELADNTIRFAKLSTSGKGNKISVVRNPASIEKITCIPLFMMNSFVTGMKPILDNNIVEFTFMKDNGNERILNTTLNSDIMLSYYEDTNYVKKVLSGVDIDTQQQGAVQMSQGMNRGRGYIKIPELGASIYDGTGTRSLNLARILKARVVSEVDRSFIKVDLNSVIDHFKDALETLIARQPDALRVLCKDLCDKEIPEDATPSYMYGSLVQELEVKQHFLSTVYNRYLHTYMLTHPMYFPMYTGRPDMDEPSITPQGNNFNIGFADSLDCFG